ncbi:MAG TPA: pilus assembly PilX N-terminal domain-containing protein [Tepidisphaeraceae bacterium]|nr:pilus assembly PilX N-terminal domain-containing protein [Tepidisphaeraceae bacterium]
MQMHKRNRRGVAAVLAMLYLVLFSILALGFYASTATSVQVSANDRRGSLAMMAAESGMDFMRYQLASVTMPDKIEIQTIDPFTKVYETLAAQLGGTANVGSVACSGDTIYIPAHQANYIYLDPNKTGARFQVTIKDLGQKMLVKVVGQHNDPSIRRAIQMEYDVVEKTSRIFDFGVASKGRIYTGGHAIIRGATDWRRGSVLSTYVDPLNPTSPIDIITIEGTEVSGDIAITSEYGNIVYKRGNTIIGNTKDPNEIDQNHIHKGVTAPPFPQVHADIFQPFVQTTYGGTGTVSGDVTLANCRIPAGSDISFTGKVTIKGVLYVETPATLHFGGGTTIQGIIVSQTDNPTGTLATNVLDFKGNVTAYNLAGLDSSTATPPGAATDLRKLTGAFILAPNFQVNFTGSFGTVAGSIIAGNVTMSGNAGGTVVGSIINLSDTTMTVNGSSEILVASTGTKDYPAGVYIEQYYRPCMDTYAEVKP